MYERKSQKFGLNLRFGTKENRKQNSANTKLCGPSQLAAQVMDNTYYTHKSDALNSTLVFAI